MTTSSHHPRLQALGLLAAILSAATFATSGPFAKSLLEAGWSSGAVVLLRVGGAAIVLLPAVVVALRGRWQLVRENLRAISVYGLVAIAACQVSYFYAVQRLEVGIALLLEYLGVVLIVLWVWWRTKRPPVRLTLAGIVLSVVGLALVLDLGGATRPDLVGVFWGLLAAVGLAVYFVTAAEESDLPPVALAGLGMVVGAVALGLSGALGLVPLEVSSRDIVLAGAILPWWSAIAELVLVAAAAAYLLGIVAARRLGSTTSGFIGLTEVLFAVTWAALLLGEVPGPVQAVGGAVVLAGVVAVRVGELRAAARHLAEVAAAPELTAVAVPPVEATIAANAEGPAESPDQPRGIPVGCAPTLEAVDG